MLYDYVTKQNIIIRLYIQLFLKKFFIVKKRHALILVVIFQLLSILAIHYWSLFGLRITSERLNLGNFREEDVKRWYFSFVSYENINNFIEIDSSQTDLLNSLESYNSHIGNQESDYFIKLPSLNLESTEYTSQAVSPSFAIINDLKVPIGEKFSTSKVSAVYVIDKKLRLSGYIIGVPLNTENKTDSELILGGKNREDFKSEFKSELLSSIAHPTEQRELLQVKVENLRDATLGKILIDGENIDKYKLGSIEVFNNTCKSGTLLDIEYDRDNKKYIIEEFSQVIQNSCKNETEVKCVDCFYAPIDKVFSLPSSYVPKLIKTNLSGGGSLTLETRDALTSLDNGMAKEGLSLYITSAYRSYEEQKVTFNSWVLSEINKGASPEEAFQRANNYSAYPGHSEHQLGTTIDIKCPGCDPFSKDVANSPFYKFLYKHAHEYGFIISYPEGKQSLTGYSFEPWHIRFIGIDMATELFNLGYLEDGSNNYLSMFLRGKGLY